MKNRKHRLLAVILAATVAFTGVCSGGTAQAAKMQEEDSSSEVLAAVQEDGRAAAQGSEEEYAGYLFAYFTGSSQAIHFAVSEDGYHYTALNDNKPVITQTVGRKVARDPYIIKGQNGDYYMLATDLKGGDTKLELKNDGTYKWGANTSIVTWHSTDLVNWDNETLITIRGEYESTKGMNQNFVWAPEAIWDAEQGEYMIFWSMQGGDTYGDDLMIWYAYTTDFKTLTSEPAVLFNPGVTGLNLKPVGSNGSDCIDANIVEHDGKYYMYYKWSGGNGAGIQVAVSDSLTGQYLPVGYDTETGNKVQQSPGALCGSAYVEGGDVYKLNGQDKWLLVADHNWSKFYGMAESTDLIHWTDVNDKDCSINFGGDDKTKNPKHGAVIPITEEQYAALWEKWGTAEGGGTEESSALISHTVPSEYPDSPADCSQDPIASYDFEDVDGFTILDGSGNSHDATMIGTEGTGSNQWSVTDGVLKLNNSTTVTSGGSDGCYLKLPNIFNSGMDTMTISFDVNASFSQHSNYFTWAIGDPNTVPDKTVGAYFYGRVNSGAIVSHITKSGYNNEIGGADTTAAMSNFGTTINLMYVFKPDRISVFRNGFLVGETASTIKISDMGTSLESYLGKSFFSKDGLFNGTFDNIKIYNRALSDEEILEAYRPNYLFRKVSIQGAWVIKEKVNETTRTITQYVSVNNSEVKNWRSAAAEFTVKSGYKISGLKGAYNFLDGAKLTITSEKDASDTTEWTVKVILCNNPAIGGLYADPDIDVFDGKYYIYPTTDGFTGWNTQKFHVFSSEDMVEWKDEGVILDLSAGDVAWANTTNCYAWAPAIEEKNGKYYFYFCGRDKSTNQQAIGVAVADSPTGPFVAEPEPLMTEQACRDAGGQLSQAIDPAIYTDEETGDSYMLFGNGGNGHNIVKLNEDMVSWDAATMYHYPNGTFPDFRESIHVFKKGGKYHFTWSCSDTGEEEYRINYAVAKSLYPEKNEDGTWGTFKAENKGTILYKVLKDDILGTGHHCFVKIPTRDEYYIAYARFGTPLSNYPGKKDVKGCHREICLEPVTFDEDGFIEKIIPTLTGIQEPVYVNPEDHKKPPISEHTHSYVESVTPATTKADGSVVSKCSCGDVKSTVAIPGIKDVKLSAETFTYNKKAKTPTVTVYDKNSKKISSAYYTVTQPSGRKNVGTYKVTVTFKGNYSGTVTKNFKIVPADVKLTKVSAAKKGFTAKWKKGSDITGYELQYSTSSKFSKAKTKQVAKAKTSSKKVTGLKAKKKYYVRIRAYKTVGKTKYVSGWSKPKTVKTK